MVSTSQPDPCPSLLSEEGAPEVRPSLMAELHGQCNTFDTFVAEQRTLYAAAEPSNAVL